MVGSDFAATVAEYGRIAWELSRLYTEHGEDPSDLVQEIYLQWWRSRETYTGASKLSTWLYTVGLHTALTYRRQRARHPFTISLPEGGDLADPAAATGEDQHLWRLALEQALATLEPGERALAYLWLEECSYKEIATITGISIANVGVKLHRIRKRLRVILGGRKSL